MSKVKLDGLYREIITREPCNLDHQNNMYYTWIQFGSPNIEILQEVPIKKV